MAKKQPQKIAAIKLTPEQRDIIAEGIESEFFKIIAETILPQRRIQLALTLAEADQSMEEVFYHRGMIRLCKWLPQWMKGEVAHVDSGKYDNEDEEVSADDEQI